MAILMSTYNIHFLDKIGKIPKISLNICFLELLEEFPRGVKNKFELAIVNKSSVFKSLGFTVKNFQKSVYYKKLIGHTHFSP